MTHLPHGVQIRAETSQWNWRFRFQLGRQLPLLAVIFSPAATYSVIFKLVMELLQDPIAEVRNAATKVSLRTVMQSYLSQTLLAHGERWWAS